MGNRRVHRPALASAASILLATALASFPPAAASAASQVVDSLSFLHVGPPSGPSNLPQILDSHGRSVLLRGVAINGLEDYYSNSSTPTAVAYPTDPAAYTGGKCPVRNSTVESMAVCDFDAAQVRGFGYDVVRLAVSWSLLEPQPGQIDQTYVERIAQVVGWLRDQGIYSVIDVHQDAWSKYLYTAPGQSCPPPFSPVTGSHEADGAPDWASTHVTPVCQVAAREVNPSVQEDFQRLWSNLSAVDGVGLQDHFAHALAALAQRFAGEPAVAGYDIFNEPSPGYTPPPAMDSSEIFPFYAKVIQTVRDTVPHFQQLFFIEPDVTRDVTDQRYAFAPWSTFSPYPEVVYAPHIYTHVFTPDSEANAPALGPLYPVSAGYASAAADAQSLGVPLWDGEFGIDVPNDDTTLRAHYASQDQLAVGGSLWVWKADGTAQSGGFSAMQGPFGRGTPYPSRVKFSDRAYPIYTAGTLQSLSYDPDHATFALSATASTVAVGDRARATLIYVPAAANTPIRATGANLEVVALADGAREAYVYPDGGTYHVFQGPAGAGGVSADTTFVTPGRRVTVSDAGSTVAVAGIGAIRVPRAGRCVSRRRLIIHVRVLRGVRVLDAVVVVRGHRTPIRLRRTLAAAVDLRGLPRGRFTVLVELRVIAHGRPTTIRVKRSFRTCVPRRRSRPGHTRPHR